jgi:hypothetical protein
MSERQRKAFFAQLAGRIQKKGGTTKGHYILFHATPKSYMRKTPKRHTRVKPAKEILTKGLRLKYSLATESYAYLAPAEGMKEVERVLLKNKKRAHKYERGHAWLAMAVPGKHVRAKSRKYGMVMPLSRHFTKERFAREMVITQKVPPEQIAYLTPKEMKRLTTIVGRKERFKPKSRR